MTEDRHPDGRITVERRGHVQLMGFDRAEKLNGLTPKMFDELAAAYLELDEDPDLRVGVLFAHGPNFTAGLQLDKFVEAQKQGRSGLSGEGVDVMGLKSKLKKPLITAVQGYTYTAGIELMLAGDIVVAAEDARFSQLEPKRGIMATGGATVRFVQRCGWGNAMYHLLRSDVFDAQEALRVGLVQEVVPTGSQLDRALEIAGEIAVQAPLAIQATKASAMQYIEQGEAAAFANFDPMQAKLRESEDAAEGLQSFVERREAVFKGR
jgi:enoyl-CoA hydratase/carnithine racemase